MIQRPKRKKHSLWIFCLDLFGILLIPALFLVFEVDQLDDPIFIVKQVKHEIPSLSQNVDLDGQAFVLVDSQTNQIIYQKNIQQSLPIASISKIIPTYLIYEALKRGELHLDDQVTVTPEIAQLSTEAGLSNVKLNVGSTYSVQDLLYATILSSANAGVMALANKLAPLEVVNDREQQLLQKFGLHDFKIVNVNGLPNEMLGNLRNPKTQTNAENMLSAAGVGIVAAKLVNDYPDVLEISKASSYIFKNGTNEAQEIKNTNELLPGLTYNDPNLEVVGLKTGTNDFGYSFVGTLKTDDHLITTVILNSSSDSARFMQTRDFLHRFKEDYHLVTINLNTNENVKKAAINFQKQYHLEKVHSTDLTLWVPKNVQANDFNFNLNYDLEYFDKTKKPGLSLTLDLPNEKLQFLQTANLSIKLR